MPSQKTYVVTWRRKYSEAARRLGSELESRRLVEESAVADWPFALDEVVTTRADRYFESMVERRAAGEPLQYVLGRWGFRGLDLFVDRRVLIPRPETEQVVSVALGALDRRAPGSPTVVDLGTGSGAIAISVAVERPGTAVWATDVSEEALAVATANLAGTAGRAAAGVHLVHGSWWSALPSELAGTVDVAVSNPPYISAGEMGNLDAVVAGWEPRQALEGGPTGLEAIERVIEGAPGWLAPGGALVVEIAPHQAGTARALARTAGFRHVVVHHDLAGRDRVLLAENY
ncbi:MAG TPA: peptide chain release factor N(5)-glutamine methyltransferase [Acidimicrobiales bacterium]|jgi:release factor glutamine methyltransferase|nr:peptide chain release factor N(5)-glutamine methyltransferase [Acidimicrobiales bacterium]